MSDLAGRLPELSTEVPGPASRNLAERLRAVEAQNITFLGERFPVFWDEAAGANVRDADGNVFLDLTGAFGVALAGHANPLVTARIEAQVKHLVHGMGDVHPPVVKVRLLERLARLSPWEHTRTILTGSGSEAVEVALKTAALATGRHGVLAFRGGYHGLTAGALSVTHRSHFRAPFRERLFAGVAFAPFPQESGDDVEIALDSARDHLESGAPGGHAIGAVIVEPIQGRAGVRVPPPGFLAELTRLARAAGCVMIMDEIFTGFGRTGDLFASVAADAVPDILCVGKAMGGGVPIGACMGSAAVMDAWPPSTGEAIHTSTFLGHPLAAAAAMGFLDELEEGDIVARVRQVGEALEGELRSALDGVGGVRELRGRGLMLAIELAAADGLPFAGGGAGVAEEALERGILVLPAGDVGQVVALAPPVTLTSEQREFAAREITTCIRSVLSRYREG
jgi:4-aminobutyrate aminotransferase/(S)-3-amino-2-methylpropionate transaminase